MDRKIVALKCGGATESRSPGGMGEDTGFDVQRLMFDGGAKFNVRDCSLSRVQDSEDRENNGEL